MDIFDQIEQERKGLPTEKVQKQDIFDQLLREKSKGGAIGRAAKGAISGLGTYGDILDIIGVQSKEQMLPGQKAIFEAEQRVPEHMKPYFAEEELTYGRLPSSEEASKFAEMLGAPKGEGLTFPERALERGAKAITGTAMLGGTPQALGLAGAGGTLGQATEEITGSPLAGTVAEIATTLTPGKKILTKATKPSGIPKYKFENVKQPISVSPKIIEKLDKNIENQFKKKASSLLSDSPIAKAKAADKNFKNQLDKSFEKVEEIAKGLPNKIDNELLEKELIDIATERTKKGITPSDYEKDYRKHLKQIVKEFPMEESSISDLVGQFRKNNKSLSEIYEPGAAPYKNQAKQDILSDYNRAIEKVFEKELSENNFTDFFKSTNKNWSEYRHLEDIENVLNNMFTNGLDFATAEKAIGSNKFNNSLKTIIGKKGTEDFIKLMDDFVSLKDARSMLKEAKSKGIAAASAHLLGYLVHPGISGTYLGTKALKHLYHKSLANPQILVDWRKGLELAKKGDLQGAFANFKKIDKENKKSNRKSFPQS